MKEQPTNRLNQKQRNTQQGEAQQQRQLHSLLGGSAVVQITNHIVGVAELSFVQVRLQWKMHLRLGGNPDELVDQLGAAGDEPKCATRLVAISRE